MKINLNESLEPLVPVPSPEPLSNYRKLSREELREFIQLELDTLSRRNPRK